MTTRRHVAAHLDLRALGLATLVVAPLALAAWLQGDARWLQAALVTMSAFIAMDRAKLAPVGVVLQMAVTLASYFALLAASVEPPVFIALATALAAFSVWLTERTAQVRSLGSFTYIPALYLACGTAGQQSADAPLQRGVAWLPMLLCSGAPVLLLSVWQHAWASRKAKNLTRHWRAFRRAGNKKTSDARQRQAAWATALAVAVAATVVQVCNIPHGQWLIWSAASVVTGDANSGRAKMRDRALGALLGVPAGVAVATLLPHNATIAGVASVIALLTLVAFRRYIWGIGLRCACVALALSLAGQSMLVASERIVNLVLGGLLGIAAVAVVQRVAGNSVSLRLQRRLTRRRRHARP